MSNQAQGATTAPTIFQSESTQLRVVTIDGEPWFIAADVCAALELGNNRQATARLDDDERGVILTDTPSGQQQMTIINESGLYSLILGSRKPEAKKFKKWVTAEVLPAIRKTGRYEIPDVSEPSKSIPYATKEQREPLVNAVRRLVKTAESKGRSLSYSDAHSIINLKMGVIDVEHLSVDQIPQAMALVGELLERIVLEGDYIAKGEPEPKPNPTQSQSPESEALSGNDMRNLRRLVHNCANQMRLKNSMVSAIWYRIRHVTNTKSPHPLRVDDIPAIANELSNIMQMSRQIIEFTRNAERDAMRRILRSDEAYEAVVADIASRGLAEEEANPSLKGFDKKELDRFIARKNARFTPPAECAEPTTSAST